MKLYPLPLITVFHESYIDTKSTATAIKTKLSKLNTYVPTVEHEIFKFNVYVKILIQLIQSRA